MPAEGASLLIWQHWGGLPVEALGPLRGMLVTGIGVICLHENHAFNRARCVPTLQGLALRERRTRCQELLDSDFVLAGLERPVHQKGHGRC